MRSQACTFLGELDVAEIGIAAVLEFVVCLVENLLLFLLFGDHLDVEGDLGDRVSRALFG